MLAYRQSHAVTETDDVKADGSKAGDTQLEDGQADEYQAQSAEADDVKADGSKADDTQLEDGQADEYQAQSVEPDDGHPNDDLLRPISR